MDFPEAILDPAYATHWAMLDWCGGPFVWIGLEEAGVCFGMENMALWRRSPLASDRSGSRRPKR